MFHDRPRLPAARGIAPSTEALIAFRLLPGAAAALMIPQGFGIIRAAFGPDEIGKAFALFGRRAFSAGPACALVFFAGMIGLMLVFSLYLQLGLHFSPGETGLAFVPWSVGTAIGAGLGAGALSPGSAVPRCTSAPP